MIIIIEQQQLNNQNLETVSVMKLNEIIIFVELGKLTISFPMNSIECSIIVIT